MTEPNDEIVQSLCLNEYSDMGLIVSDLLDSGMEPEQVKEFIIDVRYGLHNRAAATVKKAEFDFLETKEEFEEIINDVNDKELKRKLKESYDTACIHESPIAAIIDNGNGKRDSMWLNPYSGSVLDFAYKYYRYTSSSKTLEAAIINSYAFALIRQWLEIDIFYSYPNIKKKFMDTRKRSIMRGLLKTVAMAFLFILVIIAGYQIEEKTNYLIILLFFITAYIIKGHTIDQEDKKIMEKIQLVENSYYLLQPSTLDAHAARIAFQQMIKAGLRVDPFIFKIIEKYSR